MRPIPIDVYNALKSQSLIGSNGSTGYVEFIDKATGNNIIPYTNCQISREDAAFAQSCSIEFCNVNPDNSQDVGYYSPDRGVDNPNLKNDWQNEIMPGKNIVVKMGYGNNVIQCFKGCIDQVTLDTGYKIKIECRDDAWKLLDAQVYDSSTGQYYLRYENMDTSLIANDIFIRAGFDSKDITIGLSSIILTLKEFQNCSWADAISQLMDLSSFEFVCDEYGKITFLRVEDMEPKIQKELQTFTNDIITLNNHPILGSSEAIKNSSSSEKYIKDTDYTIDYKTGVIKRISGGAIPEGCEISVDYTYAAYIFEEGKDLLNIQYKISRFKQYAKIIAQGDGVEGMYSLPDPSSRGVPESKVIFLNDNGLNTEAKCRNTANRIGTDMAKRYRQIDFSAVGVPWIGIGDCVQIIESSTTVSELYKITSVALEQTADGGIVMNCTAYYYGYTPL